MNFVTNAENPTKPVNLDAVVTYKAVDPLGGLTFNIVFIGAGGPSVYWNFAVEADRDDAMTALDTIAAGTPVA